MKDVWSPADFDAACETDAILRQDDVVVNRNIEAEMFLHRSGKPLKDVDFEKGQGELFQLICDGGCMT